MTLQIQTTSKLYLLEYLKDHYDIIIAITIVSVISSIFALSQSSNIKTAFIYKFTNFLIGVVIGMAVGIYLDLNSPQSAVSIIGAIIASSNGSTLLKTFSMLLPQALNLYIKSKFNIEINQLHTNSQKETVNKNDDKREIKDSAPKSDSKKLP